MKRIYFILAAYMLSSYLPVLAQKFDKEGHRGARGLMPENSIPAMQKAVALGVTLEMDISFSKDKQVLVAHDQTISSLIALKPNGDSISKAEEQELKLYQMPYATIKTYVYGQKYYPLFPDQQKIKTYVPLLTEVIKAAEGEAKRLHKVPLTYNIEIKTSPEGDNILHPAPEEFADRLMAVIKAQGIAKRVIIQSFDVRALEVMHQKFPDIPLSYLVQKGGLEQNLQKLSFMPNIYSPKDIQRLKAAVVDGLISDYPDRL